MTTIDLLQIYRDTQAALDTNARAKADLQHRILAMLADALREVRIDAGWTVDQIARHAGTDAYTVNRCEAGHAFPNLNVVMTYRDAQLAVEPRDRAHLPPVRHLAIVARGKLPSGRLYHRAMTACGHGLPTGQDNVTGDPQKVNCTLCMTSPGYKALTPHLKPE